MESATTATGTLYLQSIKKQFRSYQSMGEKTFEQLTEEEINRIPAPNSNSITTIVRHMSGNMLSRFTNFLTEDGEKSWRRRDEEFESGHPLDKTALLECWYAGWNCLFATLEELRPEDLTKTVTIRNEPHLALDAINRQLAHHASHVGQIVLLGKLYREQNWKTLSIAPGNSNVFNDEMREKFNPKKD